jgi:putative membrane protein
MSTSYLWLQALHVASMVAWFAGLFYLPRLFLYHARASDAPGRERFQTMEMRLFVVVLGYLLLVTHTSLVTETWLRVKLVLVAGVAVYHYRCYRWAVRLRGENGPRDSRWLRWFAEIPVALLLAIVLLAVARPF